MRVLIIDNNFSVLQDIKKMLREYEVHVASDWETVVKATYNKPFGVIFIDFVMIAEHGPSAVESLRILSPSALFVMMSGIPGRDVITRSVSYGVDGFLATDELDEIPALLDRLVIQKRRYADPHG